MSEVLAQLIVTAARYDLPHTLLHFPRFATDPDYTFAKLGALDPTLTVDDYRRVVRDRYNAEYVHEQPLDRTERLKVRLTTPVAMVKRAAATANRRARRAKATAPTAPGTSK